MASTIQSSKLAQLVADMRAKRAVAPIFNAPAIVQDINAEYIAKHEIPSTISQEELNGQETVNTIDIPITPDCSGSNNTVTDKYGNEITYNEKQKEFIDLGASGKSAILIGAAGTGKTTCQKGLTHALIDNGSAGILESQGHKYLQSGSPGILICAYTRRAVANIKRNMPLDLQANCITIHKLLEYQPVFYEILDPESGKMRNTMRFEATRDRDNPLPSSIRTIIYEESSMIGTDLYAEVQNAMPHSHQEIFLGDIQQLPPVFGPAILGFKLLELPTIELTEVYRQALESPIIALAHRVLSGVPIPAKEFPSWRKEGQMTIRPWKKSISGIDAVNTLGLMFIELEKAGHYDPEEDMILCPYNEACGTIELNNKIANHLARKAGGYVYQIIAGFEKRYFRIGERILVDKEDATIIQIDTNPAYAGTAPAPHSVTLDYWGFDPEAHSQNRTDGQTDDNDEAVDFVLAQMAAKESGDRVHAASHIITVRMNDSDQDLQLSKAADINSILLGYSLTVHKAQGSEWRKVYFVTHQSHAKMMSRELIYTAITRAREELFIICEPDAFMKGIKSQRIKGNTLVEKAEYFKGKQRQRESENAS